jgi:hypothetical protein
MAGVRQWLSSDHVGIQTEVTIDTTTEECCFLCSPCRDVISRMSFVCAAGPCQRSTSRVPRDSDPKEIALARSSSTYKRQTRPLIREGAPQKQDRNCQTVINIWSCSKPRFTDWLAVSRIVTLTLTNESVVGQSPAGKGVSTEAEDIVGSVTRQRLVNTQQIEKT